MHVTSFSIGLGNAKSDIRNTFKWNEAHMEAPFIKLPHLYNPDGEKNSITHGQKKCLYESVGRSDVSFGHEKKVVSGAQLI